MKETKNTNNFINATEPFPNNTSFDPINPSYYRDGKIEVSDFIADKNLNFFCGNVVKYVCRAGKKDASTHIQDLEKAKWYLEGEIRRLTQQ